MPIEISTVIFCVLVRLSFSVTWWHHMCVCFISDITCVFVLLVTSHVCLIYQRHHMCVWFISDITCVFDSSVTSHVCLIYHWHYMCVWFISDIICVFDLSVTSHVCVCQWNNIHVWLSVTSHFYLISDIRITWVIVCMLVTLHKCYISYIACVFVCDITCVF